VICRLLRDSGRCNWECSTPKSYSTSLDVQLIDVGMDSAEGNGHSLIGKASPS